MMQRILISLLTLASSYVAVGDEYWIAYEGNGFPENEGWIRDASDPAAERWLQGGSLFIDSRADILMFENYYKTSFGGGLDPGPGEMFIMRWGLTVHEAAPWDDPGVYVLSDDSHAVGFVFDEDTLWSLYERNVSASFEPGIFHQFELRSGNMRSYELYIDDDLVIEGAFGASFSETSVGWGDIVRGSSSLAEWDYFRFGVVPEPSGFMLALVAAACIRRRRILIEET